MSHHSERHKKFFASKLDICRYPQIQPGVTFGVYGEESLRAIKGLQMCWTPLVPKSPDTPTIVLGQDCPLAMFSVTSLTLSEVSDEEDRVLLLDSPVLSQTISLSHPILTTFHSNQTIIETARTNWLDYIGLLPDSNPTTKSDSPPFKSYLEGAYLDEYTFGFFCINKISRGYTPVPLIPSLSVKLLSFAQLQTLQFRNSASEYCLEYLYRQEMAYEQPFDSAITAKPLNWALRN